MRIISKGMFTAFGEQKNKANMLTPLFSAKTIIFPFTDKKDTAPAQSYSITKKVVFANKEIPFKLADKTLLIPIIEDNSLHSYINKSVINRSPKLAKSMFFGAVNRINNFILNPFLSPRNHWLIFYYDPSNELKNESQNKLSYTSSYHDFPTEFGSVIKEENHKLIVQYNRSAGQESTVRIDDLHLAQVFKAVDQSTESHTTENQHNHSESHLNSDEHLNSDNAVEDSQSRHASSASAGIINGTSSVSSRTSLISSPPNNVQAEKNTESNPVIIASNEDNNNDIEPEFSEYKNNPTKFYASFYILAISSSLVVAGSAVIIASFLVASFPVSATIAGVVSCGLGVTGLITYGLFKLNQAPTSLPETLPTFGNI